MAVRIRLTRIGRMHRPFYRIGAFDSRTRRDGAALEYLGYYDPMLTTGTRVKLDKEKAEAWVAKGALPSETVASFFREAGIAYKKNARNKARNKKRTAKRQKAQAAKK
ncbi:MAG: 30S ribosomal protein S16 [Deltaproteobacteria bacterium]|nr:30S ribosomal protein S16 [Deltaproteobacteria bacterium]